MQRGNWNFDNTNITPDGFTGQKSLLLTGVQEIQSNYAVTQNKKYTLQFWAKGAAPKVKLGGVIQPVLFLAQKESGNWKFYSIEVTGNGGLLALIRDNTISNLPMQLDEVRLFPSDASMSSFTYNTVAGKPATVTDTKGLTVFYHYDGLGRLIKVTDEKGFIVTNYSYKIHEQE